ncbi:MAG: TonB-dependent receptor [Myxococcota bacterium]
MRREFVGVGLACGLFVSTVAIRGSAQTPGGDLEQASDERVEVIVIQASRVDLAADELAQKTQVISRSSLEREELLNADPSTILSRLVPSYSPSRRRLTGFGETFRGREPLFLVDGVPQSNPIRNGSRDGFTIDISVVERIEVIFGANAIQGLGATGGIINFVTLDAPVGDEWMVKATLQGEVANELLDDGAEGRATLTVGKRIGPIDAVAGVAYHRRGIFYDANSRAIGVDTTQGDLADSEEWNLFAKLGTDLTEHQRIEFTVNRFDLAQNGDFILVPGDRATGVTTTATEGDLEGEPASNEATMISANYEHTDLFGGSLELQLFRQDFEAVFGGGVFDIFQDPTIAPVGELFEQSANVSEKWGARINYVQPEIASLPLRAVLGLDAIHDRNAQTLVQTDREWVPSSDLLEVAPFVQSILSVGDFLIVSGGVRFENVRLSVDDFETIAGNRDDLETTAVAGGNLNFFRALPNAGLVIKPGAWWSSLEGSSVFASYSEGFTVPDIGRVLRAINTEGQAVEDILTLDPIITDNFEAGIEWAGPRVDARLSGFLSTADLGSRLVVNADGIFDVERQATRIYGAEASVEFGPFAGFVFGSRTSAVTGRFDSDADGDVDSDLGGVNIPPVRVDAYARYRIEDLEASLQSQTFFSRSFDDSEGTITAEFDGYTVVDATLGYEFLPGFVARLGVENLSDVFYITYFAQTATTRDDQFFAGQGRRFSAALSYAL